MADTKRKGEMPKGEMEEVPKGKKRAVTEGEMPAGKMEEEK